MHYLHKILVYIPSAIPAYEGATRDEILEAVRNHARNETEDFQGRVFDWREEYSAGGWESTYPQQAYLAAEDLEWFIRELEKVRLEQKKTLDSNLAKLTEAAGTDLAEIVDGLWERDDRSGKHHARFNGMTAYYFRDAAHLLYGDYTIESGFYNTYLYTARLSQSDLTEIRNTPDKWALVMFDYHY